VLHLVGLKLVLQKARLTKMGQVSMKSFVL